MNPKDDDVQETTREKLNDAAKSSLVQLVLPGAMTIATIFLGWGVHQLSDHFDRIDAHLAASDTSTVVLRRDVDELKALVPVREAQIKAVAAEADHTAWEVGDLQRDRAAGRR